MPKDNYLWEYRCEVVSLAGWAASSCPSEGEPSQKAGRNPGEGCWQDPPLNQAITTYTKIIPANTHIYN